MHSIVGLLSGWKGHDKKDSKSAKVQQPDPKEVLEKNLASLNLEQKHCSLQNADIKSWASNSNSNSNRNSITNSSSSNCNKPSKGKSKFSDDSAYIGDDKTSSSSDRHGDLATPPDSQAHSSSTNHSRTTSVHSMPGRSTPGRSTPDRASIDTARLASDSGSSRPQDTPGLSSLSERERDTSSNGESSNSLAMLGMYGHPVRSSIDRRSRDSAASAFTQGSSRSRRSSFAIERASLESNRASLEIFRRSPQYAAPIPEAQGANERTLCTALNIPKELWPKFIALGVIPVDTPVPMSMLRHLWKVTENAVAEKLANYFTSVGVMKMATLSDNTIWALVQPGHLKALQSLPAESLVGVHQKLIKAYEGRKHVSLADVPDDGYIMQNVGHHLLNVRALSKLEALLLRPAWLECKLHSYGVASVVSDFRRYLMVEHDEGIKLLLEAFQMSVSACLAHPNISMLGEQLQGRLQLSRLSCHAELDLSPLECGDSSQVQSIASLTTCSPSLEQAGGLQRMTLRGHSRGVTKVLVTPGGVDVITGSADGTARVWDMEIGDCVLLLEGHTSPITDMAISTDGSVVATASQDGTARIWDMEEGTCLNVLVGHTGSVRSIAVDQHGKIAVSAGEDGTGRVWNLATGDCVQLLLGHTSLGALSRIVLTKDGQKAITCSNDFTARVWEVYTGRCVHVLAGHTGFVIDAALTTDGSMAITAGHDGTARVWSMLDGRCIHVLGGHSGQINAVRIAPHDMFVITVSDDYTARVHDLKSGRCLHSLEGHGGWIADCAITSSCSTAITVAGDDLAVVWDLPTGKCQNVLEGHSDEVLSVELTRKGRFAVTGSMDGTARVWDLQAKSVHLQQAHTGRVHGLVVTPDQSTIVSYGDDGCLVWDAKQRKCSNSLPGPAVRWASCLDSGDKLLCACGDKTTTLWDLKTCTGASAMRGSRGSRVKSWNASKNGQIAAVLLFDSTVTVWDLERQEQINVLQRWGQRDEASGHTGGINAVCVTDDGKSVLTVSKDCTARVWDVNEGRVTHVLTGHTDGITGMMISADSKKAVTMAYDNTARLWDLRDAICVGVMHHNQAVTKAVFSADSTLLLTASADNVAYIWSCEAGTPSLLHVLKGHTEELMGLAFSMDSHWAATCGRDNCLRLWNTTSGCMEGFFASDSGLTCCAFAGDLLVAGDDSGIIHLLALPEIEVTERAKQLAQTG